MFVPSTVRRCLQLGPKLFWTNLSNDSYKDLKGSVTEYVEAKHLSGLIKHVYKKKYCIMVSVLTNGLGDRGSILGRLVWKTQKMVLDTSFLPTLHYKAQINGKWSNSEKRVAFSPRTQCSSYWKVLASLYIYTYIYIRCLRQF